MRVNSFTCGPWEGHPAAPKNQLLSEKTVIPICFLAHFCWSDLLLCIFFFFTFLFWFVSYPCIHPEVDKRIDAGMCQGKEEEDRVDVSHQLTRIHFTFTFRILILHLNFTFYILNFTFYVLHYTFQNIINKKQYNLSNYHHSESQLKYTHEWPCSSSAERSPSISKIS